MSDEHNGPFHRAHVQLTEAIELNVYLVKGDTYAVWIDSGVKDMFSQLVKTMEDAGATDGDLRFVLHTHSHHDHIGCNGQLVEKTDCLIAAHPHYAHWHTDFEQHYQEFARPFPDLVPDTSELRDEVLSILDRPHPLDLHIDEGMRFNLGGGVLLEAIGFPGHMLAELGWFEASTRTLILGDAITGLDWPIFHSHLSVRGYRNTLSKIRRIINERDVQRVLLAHFPPMTPDEVDDLIDEASIYIDDVEATLLRIIAGNQTVTLETLWTELCRRMEREREFRALNMVYAHVEDLIWRDLIREVEPKVYSLR